VAPIPLFATSLEPYRERMVDRLRAVVEDGRYILGPEVEAFEAEFARYLGVRHCVGVANGTDAISIALRALGVRPGDEVVLPSFTFYATAEATASVGARPVFCDVDPDTYCVTPETVAAALTARTRAIVTVDLFGNVAPDLRELGVPVLEDAAQAAGASLGYRRAGSIGDVATFSFYPSKNLPGVGDGGAILTDDDEVAQLARRLRFHGSDDKVTFVEVGYNSRLDELQAAALRVLLPELDGWSAARRSVAAAYAREGLGDLVRLPVPVPDAEPAHHLFVVRHHRPDELRSALAGRGIGARGYYRVPVHRQPAMAPYAPERLELPGTEEAAATNLALPMGTGLSAGEVREVVEVCAAAPI
jgi:dTDP-3-amino-3,4,6-trideoxy-alpha-D-glucose transaminase